MGNYNSSTFSANYRTPRINDYTTTNAEEMEKINSKEKHLYHMLTPFLILNDLRQYVFQGTGPNDYLTDFFRAIYQNKHLELSIGNIGYYEIQEDGNIDNTKFKIRITTAQLQKRLHSSEADAQIMYAGAFSSQSKVKPDVPLSALMDEDFIKKFLETYRRYYELFNYAKLISRNWPGGKGLGNIIIRLHKPSGQLGVRTASRSRFSFSFLFNGDEISFNPENQWTMKEGIFDLVAWLIQHPDGFFTAEFEKKPTLSVPGNPNPLYFLMGNLFGVFDEKVLASGMYIKKDSSDKWTWNRLGSSNPQMIWLHHPNLFSQIEYPNRFDRYDDFKAKFDEFALGFKGAFPGYQKQFSGFLPDDMPFLLGTHAEYIGNERYKKIFEILAGAMRKEAVNYEKADINNKIEDSIYYLGDNEIKIYDLRQGKEVILKRVGNRYYFEEKAPWYL